MNLDLDLSLLFTNHLPTLSPFSGQNRYHHLMGPLREAEFYDAGVDKPKMYMLDYLARKCPP